MVDTSRVRFVPMLPSNTDTHRVTSPSDSETIYSSISNPMTTSVKSEISNLQHTSLWHCTTVYQLLNSSESIRTITVMIVNTDSCHIGGLTPLDWGKDWKVFIPSVKTSSTIEIKHFVMLCSSPNIMLMSSLVNL